MSIPTLFRRTVVALALVVFAGAPSRAVVVEVAAGTHDRDRTAIVVPWPAGLAPADAVSLRRLGDDRAVAAQVIPGASPGVAWILEEPLAAGASRRYRLEPASAAAAPPSVTCTDDGKALEVRVRGRTVLRYHTAVGEPPSGIDRVYRRSGQIHPILTPSGVPVTDDYPPDHAHQHGLFFAWVNTTFGGRHVDFWNQTQRTGDVRHAETLDVRQGPVFAQFRVRLRHEEVGQPGGPRPVLDEVWTVRVYDRSDAFVVDHESDQACIAARPLEVNQYHYGGFGLRGNRQWLDPDAKGNAWPDPERSGGSDFLTSEGKGRRDGNHTRPRWVDLSGRVDGRPAGVAVLDHPDNFRFPQPVRLHPNKPYFCFAPMVLGAFELAPGGSYVSRYRLVAHDGLPDRDRVESAWHDYAEPPRVRFVDERP